MFISCSSLSVSMKIIQVFEFEVHATFQTKQLKVIYVLTIKWVVHYKFTCPTLTSPSSCFAGSSGSVPSLEGGGLGPSLLGRACSDSGGSVPCKIKRETSVPVLLR
jgi:hypothetical protein